MMKLVQLLPKQIMDYWDDIRECVMVAVPPHVAQNDTSMLFIQEQLLIGTLACWLGVEDSKVVGVMTTQVVSDPVSHCRNLLIYSVTVVESHSDRMWQIAADSVRRYAREKQCANIIAYSANPHMIHIAETLGADASYRLLVFKL